MKSTTSTTYSETKRKSEYEARPLLILVPCLSRDDLLSYVDSLGDNYIAYCSSAFKARNAMDTWSISGSIGVIASWKFRSLGITIIISLYHGERQNFVAAENLTFFQDDFRMSIPGGGA